MLGISQQIRAVLDAGAASGTVIVDPQGLANAIQGLIVSGSNTNKVTIANLKVIGVGANAANAPVDITAALNAGTKFFDALVYFALPQGQRPPIVAPDDDITQKPRTWENGEVKWPEIAKLLAGIYFYVVARANYPSGNSRNIGSAIPAFAVTLGVGNMTGDEYQSHLANFRLEDLGFDWIRHITIANLGVKLKNRLALGVAGRRWFKLFELVPITKQIKDEERRAVNVAILLSQQPASWDWHPATRDPRIIERWGSVNRALQDLAAHVYTADELGAAHAAKLIPIVPNALPQSRSWQQWNDALIEAPQHRIFA